MLVETQHDTDAAPLAGGLEPRQHRGEWRAEDVRGAVVDAHAEEQVVVPRGEPGTELDAGLLQSAAEPDPGTDVAFPNPAEGSLDAGAEFLDVAPANGTPEVAPKFTG